MRSTLLSEMGAEAARGGAGLVRGGGRLNMPLLQALAGVATCGTAILTWGLRPCFRVLVCAAGDGGRGRFCNFVREGGGRVVGGGGALLGVGRPGASP